MRRELPRFSMMITPHPTLSTFKFALLVGLIIVVAVGKIANRLLCGQFDSSLFGGSVEMIQFILLAIMIQFSSSYKRLAREYTWRWATAVAQIVGQVELGKLAGCGGVSMQTARTATWPIDARG